MRFKPDKLPGLPIARRDVHKTSFDLFILNEPIVNFGFDESTGTSLRLVHVREQNSFDRRMLAPYAKASASPTDWKPITGTSAVGRVIADAEVVECFATLGVDADDMYDGVCPEEITRLTKSHGITLYFRTLSPRDGTHKSYSTKSAGGQRLSGITFKRRGDLRSLGYRDALPFAFQCGDTPQTQTAKTGRPPDRQYQSEELLSYYGKTDARSLVRAVSSLIDWQLCRVALHAPFVTTELGFAA